MNDTLTAGTLVEQVVRFDFSTNQGDYERGYRDARRSYEVRDQTLIMAIDLISADVRQATDGIGKNTEMMKDAYEAYEGVITGLLPATITQNKNQ